MIMKDKLNKFYIKCLIRTLKEFRLYNSINRNSIISFIENDEPFQECPHVMGERFFLHYIDTKNRWALKDYYVLLISKRFINDIKSYLKGHKKENKNVTDEMLFEKLEAFQIFSFLHQKYRIGEPNNQDYLKYFYYG